MRVKLLAAVLTAIVATGLAAPQPALANGSGAADHDKAQYSRGLWPGGPDPYFYKPGRVPFYPYYDSNYWVPRAEMKNRYRYRPEHPYYASSWGYPLSCKLQGRKSCGVPFARTPARHH